MFGIMYETEDGKAFVVCATHEEAMYKANNIACMGKTVTVFDYDADSKIYMELYTT